MNNANANMLLVGVEHLRACECKFIMDRSKRLTRSGISFSIIHNQSQVMHSSFIWACNLLLEAQRKRTIAEISKHVNEWGAARHSQNLLGRRLRGSRSSINREREA